MKKSMVMAMVKALANNDIENATLILRKVILMDDLDLFFEIKEEVYESGYKIAIHGVQSYVY